MFSVLLNNELLEDASGALGNCPRRDTQSERWPVTVCVLPACSAALITLGVCLLILRIGPVSALLTPFNLHNKHKEVIVADFTEKSEP